MISSSFFLDPVAEPIILVLDPCAGTQLQELGTTGAQTTLHGVRNICDFRQKSPFISEMVRDRSMVTMER